MINLWKKICGECRIGDLDARKMTLLLFGKKTLHNDHDFLVDLSKRQTNPSFNLIFL